MDSPETNLEELLLQFVSFFYLFSVKFSAVIIIHTDPSYDEMTISVFD